MNNQKGNDYAFADPVIPDFPNPYPPKKRSIRIRVGIFLAVFTAALAGSLYYVFSRPAIYQSRAQMAIGSKNPDQRNQDTSKQDVTLQRQVLLSRDLLTKVLDDLKIVETSHGNVPSTYRSLLSMLTVHIIEDSAVVELVAEGPDKSILPLVVNAWMNRYIQLNSKMQQDYSDDTLMSLRSQLASVESKITKKQHELAEFRDKFDIATLSKDENKTISKLKGLQKSLNKATEGRVDAEADLKATQDAIEQGKWAGHYKKSPELIRYEEQAEALREKIQDLESRYTKKFILMDKNSREIIQKLETLEQKIKSKYIELQSAALERAEQQIIKTHEIEKDLLQRISESEKQAAIFSSRFAIHESLGKDLNRLEEMKRDLNEQMVSMEIKSDTDMLQVKVIEEAFLPESPTRPRYKRDAVIAAGGSLFTAIFILLLFDLLTRPLHKQENRPIYPVTYNQILESPRQAYQISNRPDEASVMLPPARPVIPRELSRKEVTGLVSAAPPHLQLMIAAILDGLEFQEFLQLEWRHIDGDINKMTIPGPFTRQVSISNHLRTLLETVADKSKKPSDQILTAGETTAEDIDQALFQLAEEIDIPEPGSVDAAALRHTYIAFLARQGVPLEEISKRAGNIPPELFEAYELLHPPGHSVSLEKADQIYPA